MIKIKTESGSRYYTSLLAKYTAEKMTAEAQLATYFDSAVGIGEHSDIITEFDVLLGKLADAEDKLDVLTKNFKLTP